MSMTDLLEKLYDAAELLRSAQQIVALTGAGISTESGIPDFRSPGSIWLSQPPVSYHDFINKPEARQQYWQTRSEERRVGKECRSGCGRGHRNDRRTCVVSHHGRDWQLKGFDRCLRY